VEQKLSKGPAMNTIVSTADKSETDAKSVNYVANRAHEELASAMVALQHAGALFVAIEKACTVDRDMDAAFLLAQIGIKAAHDHAERCNSECDYFHEARHGQ
jgi:hypothetical protein